MRAGGTEGEPVTERLTHTNQLGEWDMPPEEQEALALIRAHEGNDEDRVTK